MLVSPVLNGGAVVLMDSPKNELEFVPVNGTKQAMDAGYVPVRAVELGEFIAALKEANAQLTAENARLLLWRSILAQQILSVLNSLPSQK